MFFGDVAGSGSFPGTGIVEFAGSISPGNSLGKVSFGGDVVLGATPATTLMELAGVTDGDYDQLQVAGTLEVGGGLEVELRNGFVPTVDTDFHIFNAGTLSGTFSSVLPPNLPGMLGWDSSHLYSNGHAVRHPRTRHTPAPGSRHADGVAEAVKEVLAALLPSVCALQLRHYTDDLSDHVNWKIWRSPSFCNNEEHAETLLEYYDCGIFGSVFIGCLKDSMDPEKKSWGTWFSHAENERYELCQEPEFA